MKRSLAVALVVALAGCQLPGLASPPDVSGVWSLSTGAAMALKQAGPKVSGFYSPADGAPKPFDGRLEADRLTATVSFGLDNATTVLDMRLVGERLEGTVDGKAATARRR